MTTHEAVRAVRATLSPIANIMANLPKLSLQIKPTTPSVATEPMTMQEIAQSIHAAVPPGKSKRTYYLGFNGRVSQRKHLVGEVHATVRAHDTLEALSILLDGFEAKSVNCYVAPHVGAK